MAFSPTLEMCQVTCTKIKFIDTTQIYDASNNTGGWGATNDVTGVEVSSATIQVSDSDGNVEFTYDVTDQIPDTVQGDITYTDYTYSLSDGTYTVLYTIVVPGDTGGTYTYSQTVLVTCNFEACITKQLAKIAGAVCADSCDTSDVDDFLVIEGLLYAYKSAVMCDKTTIKTEIEKRLQRFCDYQCDC